MKVSIKYFIIGFIAAGVLGIGCMIGFSLFFDRDMTMTFHEQYLPSGKSMRITMCNFVWGGEHADRLPDQDCFAIEYVMSSPALDQIAKDREAIDSAFATLRSRLYDLYCLLEVTYNLANTAAERTRSSGTPPADAGDRASGARGSP